MDLTSLGMRERRAIQVGGYAVFFIVCFLLLTYLLFPFNRWKGTLEEVMSRQLDRKVTIGSVGSWGLLGLKLKDVTISEVEEEEDEAGQGIFEQARERAGLPAQKKVKKERKSVPLHVDKLGVRLSPLAVLGGKVGVCFDARVFDGRVKGCFVDASRSIFGGRKEGSADETGPRSSLEFKIRKIDLGEIPHLEALVGLPFHGLVQGDADISYVPGVPRTAEGHFRVSVEGLQIGEPDGKIDLSKAGGVLQGEITFEPIVVGDLVIDMEGEGGQLLVKKLEASSQHIEIKGAGDVTLREPMMLSSLNIYVMFKFLPAYTDKSSMTKTIFSALDRLPKMRKAKRPDGFFGYLIKGDLRKGPNPVPSRSGPSPSVAPPPASAGSKTSPPMGLRNKSVPKTGKPAGK